MGAVRTGVVAVTGASGLLGSHICARLLDKGFTVRAVVRDKVRMQGKGSPMLWASSTVGQPLHRTIKRRLAI